MCLSARGSADSVKTAHAMITELADSPDADVAQLLGRHRPPQAGQSAGAAGQSVGGPGQSLGADGKTVGRGQGKMAAQALTGERGVCWVLVKRGMWVVWNYWFVYAQVDVLI